MTIKVIAPKLPRALMPATSAVLVTDAHLEAVTLADQTASDIQAKGAVIDEALITKLDLTNATLEKLGLNDVILKACDLTAANCSEASWVRVAASDGRMTGLDLSRSLLKDVVFNGCKLDMANFRFAKLTQVRFIDCVLAEADFQGARLTNVAFEDCQLEGAEFSQATLQNVDARGSDIVGVRGWQYAKGLIIDTSQLMAIAPELAAGLGIRVED